MCAAVRAFDLQHPNVLEPGQPYTSIVLTPLNWESQGIQASNSSTNSLACSPHQCTADIGAWDVSSVTTMKWMFNGATSFDQGPVYVVELRLRKWVGRGVQSPVDLFRSFHAPGNRRGSKRQTHPPTHSLVHLTNVPQTSAPGMLVA